MLSGQVLDPIQSHAEMPTDARVLACAIQRWSERILGQMVCASLQLTHRTMRGFNEDPSPVAGLGILDDVGGDGGLGVLLYRTVWESRHVDRERNRLTLETRAWASESGLSLICRPRPLDDCERGERGSRMDNLVVLSISRRASMDRLDARTHFVVVGSVTSIVIVLDRLIGVLKPLGIRVNRQVVVIGLDLQLICTANPSIRYGAIAHITGCLQQSQTKAFVFRNPLPSNIDGVNRRWVRTSRSVDGCWLASHGLPNRKDCALTGMHWSEQQAYGRTGSPGTCGEHRANEGNILNRLVPEFLVFLLPGRRSLLLLLDFLFSGVLLRRGVPPAPCAI
jgi:hypothetical protein